MAALERNKTLTELRLHETAFAARPQTMARIRRLLRKNALRAAPPPPAREAPPAPAPRQSVESKPEPAPAPGPEPAPEPTCAPALEAPRRVPTPHSVSLLRHEAERCACSVVLSWAPGNRLRFAKNVLQKLTPQNPAE